MPEPRFVITLSAHSATVDFLSFSVLSVYLRPQSLDGRIPLAQSGFGKLCVEPSLVSLNSKS